MIGVLEAQKPKKRIAARSVVGVAVILAEAGMEHRKIQDQGVVC
jgi:hypothetical protein